MGHRLRNLRSENWMDVTLVFAAFADQKPFGGIGYKNNENLRG